MYRIGKDRSNNAVGVYLYCQQHAREWVTPITCLETAERLVRNYATDPTTKEYVDKLNIFILPVVNPDGGHAAFHDNSVQRKNLTNYCAPTTRELLRRQPQLLGRRPQPQQHGRLALRRLRRRELVLHERDVLRPVRGLRAGDPNEHWIADTFKGIKFANNIHTHGGYFMWAPGAYKSAGRVTLPAPNIGIEKYFFEVADTILSHIKSSRNTVILPQRTGPIADVLYSAAGNSADEQYYKRGIIAYSFEAGAQRITVNPTTGAITRTAVGFQPCFAGPGTNGGQGSACGTVAAPNALLVNEGHDSTMEFAEGNFGEIQGALEYPNDVTAAGRRRSSTRRAQTERRPDQLQVQLGRRAVGHLLHDRRHRRRMTIRTAGRRALRQHGATKCYNGQGPRRPGEVLTLTTPGAYTVKWIVGGHQGQPRGRQVAAAAGRGR